MHLYNLSILKVSQRVLSAVSNHRKNRNLKRLQAAIIKGSLYYNCCIVSDDTFYVRKFDLDTSLIQQKQIKIDQCRLTGIFLCKQSLIITTRSNQIVHIQVEALFKISISSAINLQQKDFQYFSQNQDFGDQFRNNIKFMKIREDLIMVHLQEKEIIFQKICPKSNKKWIISAWDLGYGRNDKIVDFQVKNQHLFNTDVQKSLIIGVLKILQQNGYQAFVLLQLLWDQSRYVSSQIYVYHSNSAEQNDQSRILFTTFSSFQILVYTGQHLVICKRLSEGIQVFGIMPIYYKMLDMVNIQKCFNEPQVLTVCKNKNKTKICKYNLNEILNNLIIQPKIIHSDFLSSQIGEVVGFVKLQSQIPLLVFSAETYILMPTILNLYKKITYVYAPVQTEQNQSEDNQLLQQKIDENALQFLSFSYLYRLFDRHHKQIDQAINELFSIKKMNQAISQFQKILQTQIKCLKNDIYICWNALLREYTSIFIYLLKFLNFIQQQRGQDKPFITLSDFYLLQSQQAFKKFYNQRPLVEQPKIQSIVHKKVVEIKDNLQFILHLFNKHKEEHQNTQNSTYENFQIIKKLSKSEVIQFVANKTQLVSYLAFYIYQAALNGNSHQWDIGRSLLKKIVGIRRDYPPLIGLLCGDLDNYTSSYHQLELCKMITLQQQKQRKEFQNLPYLKQTSIAARRHLEKEGFLHLLCFTPEEYDKQKYDGNFIVINIPKSCRNQTFELIKPDTIQIKEKIYLYLTQENIVKALQTMENVIKIDFSVQSRCYLYVFSQKLKIMNELFVLQLTKYFDQKRQKRQKSQNIKDNIDCRWLSNQEYMKLIKAKQFGFTDRKQKFDKKQENQSLGKTVQKFYSNLLQICENSRLHKFISHLKMNILKKKSVISDLDDLQKLDISKIPLIQKNQIPEEKKNQSFYDILFLNMWRLYQTMLQYQQTKFIDFREQLEHTSFSHSYLSIFQFLADLVEHNYKQQIDLLYGNQKINLITLQKIRKSLLNKKSHISYKNTEYLTNFKKSILLEIVRTQLLLKLFKQTGQWLYNFQELIRQAAFSQVKLSYKSQVILSNLIEINKV